MKVLQINAVYGFGSTGIIVKDIETALENNGHQSYIAYQTAINPPADSYQVGNKIDWKFHALYSRIFGKQAYASKYATKKLINYIRQISPDVVHFHNLHSNYINLNMLCDFLARKDIATVITLHDCWYFTGKCTHYAAAKCDKWQASCGNCPLIKSEQPSLFFDVTEKVLKDKTYHLNKIKNLTLVGCSEWITKEAEKSHITPKNLTTVYNGVDTAIFGPDNNNFKEKYNITKPFVIMGMADKWCLPENREAVKQIIETNKDSKIIIVGCKESQKDLFEEFENVLPLGYITDRQELSDIYALSDVFINLTHADTLPTVNMEAICCGTPVITYDCCGSPELIDNDSGFVVTENNIPDLLEKIKLIKTNPPKIIIAEKHKKFDKNTCYNAYLEIYKKITEKS